ncbi:metallophosphoesterase [Oceanibacterium hippocampi]|uniref:metallophosphoesterase n=1 Tax=Oceanibacterium hippocampi TaxID=745714 RepID=UPI002481B78F|nr:metallophosphoesterase [Oceanibacterium hippocampi]
MMSDLHLEIDRKHGIATGIDAPGHPQIGPDLRPLPGQVDLCILAGDIDRGVAAIDYADAVARFLAVPTVFIAGNHEFYHYRYRELLAAFREAAAATDGRVRFLENDEAVFDLDGRPVRVLGCTLWTDLALYGADAAERLVQSGDLLRIYDYQRIRHEDDTTIGVLDPVAWHRDSVHWLETRLAERPDGGVTVVVTHHGISPRSVAPQFEGSPLNAAFTSDLDALVERSGAALWIHGHTHHGVDYVAGATRVVSCPRGYPAERADDYSPGLIDL